MSNNFNNFNNNNNNPSSSSNNNNNNDNSNNNNSNNDHGLTLRESHSTLFNPETSTIRSNDPLLQSSISRTSSPNLLNDHIRDSNNIYLLQSNSPSQPLKLEDEKSLPITIESTPIPNNDDNDIHKDWSSPPPNYEDLEINNNINKDNNIKKQETTTDHTIIGIDETENDRHEVIANLQTDKNIRMAFVRKVYGILTLQLLTTIGVTLWFMLHEPTHTIINDNQWIFFVSMILALITLTFLFWQRRKHPFNMILLIIFTLCLSCGVASIVSLYSSKVVLQSFLITFGVFTALELFTLQTKIDFSSWGPFLYAGIWVVIFAGMVGWLFPFDAHYHMFISGMAALLFSAYIIYDTYMIFNRLNPEEYIMASVDLYLDIINLFVAMLALLTGTSDG